MTRDVYSTAARLRAGGTPFVLATVVASYPPQSVRPGAKAIVHADGTIEGWVGGGCVRPVVTQEAGEALSDGRPRLVRINAGTAAADAPARHGDVREYPMTCQGEGGVEIYLEPVLAAPRLVVLGHTPVAQSLARWGVELGFDVVAASLGATAELFPPDVRLAADAPSALAGADGATWVVVATMGAGDEEALAAAAASDAPYVGLVASRKKARQLVEYVRESGVAAERLARVKYPAGLDLGGMSAPEIALSILAEIVQRRYAARGTPPEKQDALAGPRLRDPTVADRTTPSHADGATPSAASATSSPQPASSRAATHAASHGATHAPPDTASTSAAASRADPHASGAAAPRRGRSLAVAPFPLDPVCGMPVNPAEARHTLVVGGETLYFCCPHCKAAYVRRQHAPEAEA
jgi:xanthine dehydrogenase accessory factor